MLVLPKRGKPMKKEREKNGAKGITCRIPLELHNRISEEIQGNGKHHANSSG